MMRVDMPVLLNQLASIKPAGPAPMIRTSVVDSFMMVYSYESAIFDSGSSHAGFRSPEHDTESRTQRISFCGNESKIAFSLAIIASPTWAVYPSSLPFMPVVNPVGRGKTIRSISLAAIKRDSCYKTYPF